MCVCVCVCARVCKGGSRGRLCARQRQSSAVSVRHTRPRLIACDNMLQTRAHTHTHTQTPPAHMSSRPYPLRQPHGAMKSEALVHIVRNACICMFMHVYAQDVLPFALARTCENGRPGKGENVCGVCVCACVWGGGRDPGSRWTQGPAPAEAWRGRCFQPAHLDTPACA